MTYALEPASGATDHPDLATGLSARAALEDLRRRLVRYAIKLAWNRDDAEEIVQESFGIAIEHGVTHAEARFGPWMFRTVGNLCLNKRRKRKFEPLSEWVEPVEGRAAGDHAEQVEHLEKLREAIAGLPGQQRIAIVLRGEKQMSYEDIGRVMEISESSARGHVYQARRKLSEALNKD